MELRVPGPTLGTTVRTLGIPGLTLVEAEFLPDSSLPWHAHECASFCIVLDGCVTERFRRTSHALRPHDFIFKPVEMEHANAFGLQGARCLIVELTAELMAGHERRIGRALSAACVMEGADLARRLHYELRHTDGVTPLAISAICIELIVQVARAKVPEAGGRLQWLLRARDYLHERCLDRFSLGEVASTVGVHPVHLAQAFRCRFGVTVGEYTRQLRVEAAARALVSSERPIAEIAVACGFYDQSHFTKIFKRFMASTPAAFRERSSLRSA